MRLGPTQKNRSVLLVWECLQVTPPTQAKHWRDPHLSTHQWHISPWPTSRLSDNFFNQSSCYCVILLTNRQSENTTAYCAEVNISFPYVGSGFISSPKAEAAEWARTPSPCNEGLTLRPGTARIESVSGVNWSKGWWKWCWQLDYWSCKSCKDPVKSSPPTNQHPVFTGCMRFLSPNQQCQSTEGKQRVLNTPTQNLYHSCLT